MRTPFEIELETNIVKTIRRQMNAGCTGMGIKNLWMVTPTPRTTNGAPRGTNSVSIYFAMFCAVCEANRAIKKFILED